MSDQTQPDPTEETYLQVLQQMQPTGNTAAVGDDDYAQPVDPSEQDVDDSDYEDEEGYDDDPDGDDPQPIEPAPAPDAE